MNARQKAKHYKKLYERSKITTRDTYFTESTLEHYVVTDRFDDDIMERINRYTDDMTDFMAKKHAYNLARNLEKMIPAFMEMNEDNQESRFDFWVKKRW